MFNVNPKDDVEEIKRLLKEAGLKIKDLTNSYVWLAGKHISVHMIDSKKYYDIEVEFSKEPTEIYTFKTITEIDEGEYMILQDKIRKSWWLHA